MFARDIDVILAGTKPNVEYLTDVEWMRWFNEENFLPENGENHATSFVGLPRNQKDGPFYVAPSTQTGYPENYGMWNENVRYWGLVLFVDGSDGKWIRQIIQLLEWLRDYVKRVFIKTFFCSRSILIAEIIAAAYVNLPTQLLVE